MNDYKTSSGIQACYWKDGIRVELELPAPQGGSDATTFFNEQGAHAIIVQ